MPAGSGGILSWVLIIVVFYFFLIAPERKKQKNMRNMINSIKAGDKIITRGGIYGTIVSITDEAVVIASGPDETKVELSKMSIASVLETSQATEVNEEPEADEETAETLENEVMEQNTEEKEENTEEKAE